MRRLLAGFPIALAMFLLLACARGPGPEPLQQELERRLDNYFQAGLFTVTAFKRTGSAPFHDIDSGDSGVFAYYDAQLQFQQDYSLSQWRGLNLGTLAFAIGATEAGIDGFLAAGNASGDLLRVHGRMAFAQDSQGAWVALDTFSKPAPAQELDPGPQQHGRSATAVLQDVRALLALESEQQADQRKAVITGEFATAVDKIDLRIARLEGKITLGGGRRPGTYYSFGEALSSYANSQGLSLYSAQSAGSVENASRLQAGRLDFGLVQTDVAQLLYQGMFKQGLFPSKDLRAVASLWPEAVHLLTLEGSGIRQLEDLRQRRIAVGQRGSGSRINAALIGVAAALQSDTFPRIREIDLSRAIAQLERGEIDALFLTEALPAPAIQVLASRRSDLRFVPLPAELIRQLSSEHFAYYPLTVAARTYPGQTEAFTTLGLAAALMTNVHVADEAVESMLQLLLSGGDVLARNYYRAAFITRETMRLGLAVPLHPAAERFYQRYDEAAKGANN